MKSEQPIRMVLLLALGCLGGCGGSQDADYVKASNDTNIKKVANAYHLYASRSRYTGPSSKEELINFLKNNEKIQKNLELMGLDREKIEEYFISENDGKEFTFRWGVFIDPDLERTREPLVFEQEGKNGVRLVMLSNRKILEVSSEQQYQNLLKGKVSPQDAVLELQGEEGAFAQ